MAKNLPISHQTFRKYYLRELPTGELSALVLKRQLDNGLNYLLETADLLREIAPNPVQEEDSADYTIDIMQIEALQEALFGGYADRQQAAMVAASIIKFPNIYEKLWMKSFQLGRMSEGIFPEKKSFEPDPLSLIEQSIPAFSEYQPLLLKAVAGLAAIFVFTWIILYLQSPERTSPQNMAELFFSEEVQSSYYIEKHLSADSVVVDDSDLQVQNFVKLVKQGQDFYSDRRYDDADRTFAFAEQQRRKLMTSDRLDNTEKILRAFYFGYGETKLALAFLKPEDSDERQRLTAEALAAIEQAALPSSESASLALSNRQRLIYAITLKMRGKTVLDTIKNDARIVAMRKAVLESEPLSFYTHHSSEEGTMDVLVLLLQLLQVILLVVLIQTVKKCCKKRGRGDGESEGVTKEKPDTSGGSGGASGSQGGGD